MHIYLYIYCVSTYYYMDGLASVTSMVVGRTCSRPRTKCVRPTGEHVCPHPHTKCATMDAFLILLQIGIYTFHPKVSCLFVIVGFLHQH